MKAEIDLTFSRKDFEEIYFKDDQGSYIKSRTTKSAFVILSIATVIFFISLAYSIIDGNSNNFMFFGVLFMLALINYGQAFYHLYKWRSQIIDFLDKEGQVQNSRLIVTDNSLTFIQDGEQTIEKWSNFSKIKIAHDYISLEGKENYILPKKSMTQDEFETVSKLISEKVK